MEGNGERDTSDLVRRTVERFAYFEEVKIQWDPLSVATLSTSVALIAYLAINYLSNLTPNLYGFMTLVFAMICFVFFFIVPRKVNPLLILRRHFEDRLARLIMKFFGNFLTTYYLSSIIFELVVFSILIIMALAIPLMSGDLTIEPLACTTTVTILIFINASCTFYRVYCGEFGTQAREAEALIKFVIRRVDDGGLPPTDGYPPRRLLEERAQLAQGLAGHEPA